jgi:hypothetical protein
MHAAGISVSDGYSVCYTDIDIQANSYIFNQYILYKEKHYVGSL